MVRPPSVREVMSLTPVGDFGFFSWSHACVMLISSLVTVCFSVLFSREERVLDEVKIALVGKYTKLEDAYISVLKALKHASLHCNRRLKVLVSFFNFVYSALVTFSVLVIPSLKEFGLKLKRDECFKTPHVRISPMITNTTS